jgi:hypothetical protein
MATNRANNGLTAEEIVAAIMRSARRVSDYFARHPEPTDGSVKASLEIAERIVETTERKR